MDYRWDLVAFHDCEAVSQRVTISKGEQMAC